MSYPPHVPALASPPYSLPSLPAVLDEDVRETALQRTAADLRKLDEIRRALDLPPESIGFVLEIYAASARNLQIQREAERARARTSRKPMQINSADREYQPLFIRTGQFVRIFVRPQWDAFRVEDIEICGDPSRWRVHDIRVGDASQLLGIQDARPIHDACPIPIPGERFRKGGIMSGLRLDVCQSGMDFSLTVEYVGPAPEGEVFEATIVGAATDPAP